MPSVHYFRAAGLRTGPRILSDDDANQYAIQPPSCQFNTRRVVYRHLVTGGSPIRYEESPLACTLATRCNAQIGCKPKGYCMGERADWKCPERKRLPDCNFENFSLDICQCQKSMPRSFEVTFGVTSLLGLSSSVYVNLMMCCRLDLG